MELSKQVTSLELSKRLRELGVKQESYFKWELDKTTKESALLEKGVRGCGRCGAVVNGIPRPHLAVETFSAFTVAEIGEMLPENTKTYYTAKHLGDWKAWEEEEGLYGADGNYILANTEADVRAKMLIHLIENKLI